MISSFDTFWSLSIDITHRCWLWMKSFHCTNGFAALNPRMCSNPSVCARPLSPGSCSVITSNRRSSLTLLYSSNRNLCSSQMSVEQYYMKKKKLRKRNLVLWWIFPLAECKNNNGSTGDSDAECSGESRSSVQVMRCFWKTHTHIITSNTKWASIKWLHAMVFGAELRIKDVWIIFLRGWWG